MSPKLSMSARAYKRWELKRQQGFLRFVLWEGIVLFGSLATVLTLLLHECGGDEIRVARTAGSFAVLGAFWGGVIMWHTAEWWFRRSAPPTPAHK